MARSFRLLPTSKPDILFLKYACSILRQSSEPVCGLWKSQDSSLWAKQHRAWPVPSWRNHIQGWVTVWECCTHAYKKTSDRSHVEFLASSAWFEACRCMLARANSSQLLIASPIPRVFDLLRSRQVKGLSFIITSSTFRSLIVLWATKPEVLISWYIGQKLSLVEYNWRSLSLFWQPANEPPNPGGRYQPKKSPGQFTTWSRRFLWPGSTNFVKFGVIWKPWKPQMKEEIQGFHMTPNFTKLVDPGQRNLPLHVV